MQAQKHHINPYSMQRSSPWPGLLNSWCLYKVLVLRSHAETIWQQGQTTLESEVYSFLPDSYRFADWKSRVPEACCPVYLWKMSMSLLFISEWDRIKKMAWLCREGRLLIMWRGLSCEEMSKFKDLLEARLTFAWEPRDEDRDRSVQRK